MPSDACRHERRGLRGTSEAVPGPPRPRPGAPAGAPHFTIRCRIVKCHSAGKMRSSTKITTKGQVVIPKAIRDHLRWRAGTRLQVRLLLEGGLALEAVGPSSDDATAEDPIERAFGAFRECREDVLGALEAGHRAELDDELR